MFKIALNISDGQCMSNMSEYLRKIEIKNFGMNVIEKFTLIWYPLGTIILVHPSEITGLQPIFEKFRFPRHLCMVNVCIFVHDYTLIGSKYANKSSFLFKLKKHITFLP